MMKDSRVYFSTILFLFYISSLLLDFQLVEIWLLHIEPSIKNAKVNIENRTCNVVLCKVTYHNLFLKIS